VNVGANRIVTGAGIPHVVGNPDLDPAEEKEFRRKVVERALEAISMEVDDSEVF
jgi:glycine reductase